MSDDVTCLLQNDSRWHQLLTGDGPSRIGSTGCVLVGLNNAGRVLGAIEAGVIPPHVNQRLRDAGDVFAHFDEKAGGFVDGGDELRVPRAAPLLNMEAVHEIENPLPSDVDAELDRGGVVLLRVNTRGGGPGQHSIVVTSHAGLSGYNVFCSAVGRLTLNLALEATTDWGSKQKPDIRRYKPVSMRGLRRAKV